MLAIVCERLFLPTETFIRRHIEELAPGDTVVVSKNGPLPSDSRFPVFVDDSRKSNQSWFMQKTAHAWRFVFHGYTRTPDKKTRIRLVDFLVQNQVDAILAEYGHLGCYVLPAALQTGIPLHVCFRGHDASKLIRHWQVRRSYRYLAEKAAGFICESKFIVDNLAGSKVVHPRTCIIHSGVDVDSFVPGQSRDYHKVIFIGRFVDKKAPEKTIIAFSGVVHRHPGARLEMVGDGPLLERCIGLADELGISRSVIFHGARDHEFVRSLMHRAGIYVQHSVTGSAGDTEGLPVAIQEAMSCGLPVISTIHAGIPEAVQHGVTGLLVNEHDVQGMTRAMNRLLDDPEMNRRMGLAGRRRAEEKFSASKSLSMIRDLLRQYGSLKRSNSQANQ